jgi:hypothetical protein
MSSQCRAPDLTMGAMAARQAVVSLRAFDLALRQNCSIPTVFKSSRKLSGRVHCLHVHGCRHASAQLHILALPSPQLGQPPTLSLVYVYLPRSRAGTHSQSPPPSCMLQSGTLVFALDGVLHMYQ